MFQNVLGQDPLVNSLREEISQGTLPRALLLYGPRYSGKMTIALELGRILNCQRPDAPWGCTCTSCNQHRLLMSPYTLLLGPRYFLDEISLSARSLEVEDREAGRYLFLRGVRKLTSRFEPTLWEGDEQKIAKAGPLLESLDEELGFLNPENPLKPRELTSRLNKVTTLAEKLVGVLPSDGYTVNIIRRASYWAHMTSASAKKVIILEDADRLNESARNSLLKILEEPPKDTHFILVTSRLTGIIPTLRSRLRLYHCPQRTQEREREVLQRIFRLPNQDGGGGSLVEAFANFGPDRAGEARTQAETFLASLLSPQGKFAMATEVGTWLETLSPGSRRENLRRFLGIVEQGLKDRLSLGDGGLDEAKNAVRVSAILREIDVQYQRFEQYNIPGATVVDQIFFAGMDF